LSVQDPTAVNEFTLHMSVNDFECATEWKTAPLQYE